MGRVSQAQAQENRRRIVETAARLFRERGVPGVGVADVMAEVGLTHGGFYKHFASKDALVAEAIGQAYAEQAERLAGHDGHDHARATFLDEYLSAEHRDDPGHGCPTAAFSGDLAHEAAGAGARIPYAEGVERYARWLGVDGQADLAAVSTAVGALILARATRGTELSDRILAAARAALAEPETGLSPAEGPDAAG
ncbi:TetR/AcrR family transcriptional regulator [Micromonosporaceae bacterium Da 78-11]